MIDAIVLRYLMKQFCFFNQIKFNESWKGGKVIRINNLDDAINLIQEINKKVVDL